jgi:hypothetical protein
MAQVDTARVRFLDDLLRPPHHARMIAHAAPYTMKLSRADARELVSKAIDHLFATRESIYSARSLLRLWIEALNHAAESRSVWIEMHGYEPVQVLGRRLGRR